MTGDRYCAGEGRDSAYQLSLDADRQIVKFAMFNSEFRKKLSFFLSILLLVSVQGISTRHLVHRSNFSSLACPALFARLPS